MIHLKQVIHYPNTNSVEVTWVDDLGAQVRCHSYSDVQMATLRADLGADASAHSALIALVESRIIPADPVVVPVPQRITNYQGKVTLDYYSIYDEVEAYMNLPDTPRATKLAWATGAFERQSTMILAMATILGLTNEQVDAMFIYGAGVE